MNALAEEAAPSPRAAERSTFSTLPSMIVRLLDTAGISAGDKVLEIGTGTGYSTALLCYRLGTSAITSVEDDPVAADRAGTALTLIDYLPTLAHGDELTGHPTGHPTTGSSPRASYGRSLRRG
ncbi:rRNA adenine N-6-methyltransferase family protein [Streptosporangium sp. NPDC023963]|uniref:rRNA adenine N-6-methyltransferase family protein n=1 Tax=Streptosporangium sp. NPDC023963 TaxID=3155608 RepID=UPI0034396303